MKAGFDGKKRVEIKKSRVKYVLVNSEYISINECYL
jgi:hypothetical protein